MTSVSSGKSLEKHKDQRKNNNWKNATWLTQKDFTIVYLIIKTALMLVFSVANGSTVETATTNSVLLSLGKVIWSNYLTILLS